MRIQPPPQVDAISVQDGVRSHTLVGFRLRGLLVGVWNDDVSQRGACHRSVCHAYELYNMVQILML